MSRFNLGFGAMSSHHQISGLSSRKLAGVAAVGAIFLSLIGGVGVPATASPPPSPTASPSAKVRDDAGRITLPKMRAWTWILVDADTGGVLAGRDWHWPLPPASTIKTLTALTLEPRLDLNSTYTGQQSDRDAEGSRVGVEPGSTYAVSDLFHGMLMPSGNDAASALARAYGGVDRAVGAMNAEAQRLGAKNTHAVNTSGLDEPGQTSSAYDLALIMRASLNNPQLREMYSLHHVDFPAPEEAGSTKARTAYRIWTENRLILNYYDGALAGKTGFTSQAGRTYVGAVERDGHTLIAVVMRSAENTERAVRRLLEWGFLNIDNLDPVDKLVDPQPQDGNIVRQAAATYDAQGNLTSPLPETVTESSGGGIGSWLLWGLAILIACVVIRGVYVARRNTRRRQAQAALAQPDQLDLRAKDDTDLRA